MRNKLFLSIQSKEIILEVWLFGKYLEGHWNYGDLQRRDEMKALERRVYHRAIRKDYDVNRLMREGF